MIIDAVHKYKYLNIRRCEKFTDLGSTVDKCGTNGTNWDKCNSHTNITFSPELNKRMV